MEQVVRRAVLLKDHDDMLNFGTTRLAPASTSVKRSGARAADHHKQ
jgi:hypothetical protein